MYKLCENIKNLFKEHQALSWTPQSRPIILTTANHNYKNYSSMTLTSHINRQYANLFITELNFWGSEQGLVLFKQIFGAFTKFVHNYFAYQM
jgi:hypothetical protein